MIEPTFPSMDIHELDMNGGRLILGPFASGMITVNQNCAALIGYCQGRTADECRRWVSEHYGDNCVSVVDELSALLSDGCLSELRLATDTDPGYSQVTTVQLCLSHQCQLACSYCLARETRRSANHGDMPIDTARTALRFFLDSLSGRQPATLAVAFSSSGEPLLKGDLLTGIASYAKQYADSLGVGIVFHAATNGLLVTPEAMVKLANGGQGYVGLGLSWDGPSYIHDAHRPRPDGSGTYDSVAQAYRTICDVGMYRPIVGAVITAEHPDICGVFKHLFGMGVRDMMMKPVREVEIDVGVSDRTLPAFRAAYSEFAQFLLEADAFHTERLCSLSASDYFWRFVRRVALREFSLYRCPAGRSMVCVDTNGDIYPCQDYLGMPHHRIGDVFNGFDSVARDRYLEELLCDRMQSCRSCWARYWCGGGCYTQAIKSSGRPDIPYPPDCELTKFLIELAAQFVVRIDQDHPGLLAHALEYHRPICMPDPRPTALCYHTDAASLWPRPLEDWICQTPITLGDASQAGGYRQWGGPDDLSARIHLRWNERYLYVLAEVHDDCFTPPTQSNSEWWFYDSIQIALDPLNDGGTSSNPWALTGDDCEFGMAWVDGTTNCYDCHIDRSKPSKRWLGTVIHTESGTLYRMAVPWTCVPGFDPHHGAECGFTVAVNDSDGGARVWLQWTPGITTAKRADAFGLLKLV